MGEEVRAKFPLLTILIRSKDKGDRAGGLMITSLVSDWTENVLFDFGWLHVFVVQSSTWDAECGNETKGEPLIIKCPFGLPKNLLGTNQIGS